MKFLGIDPGLERMGYGVIDQANGTVQLLEYGVLRTPVGVSTAERLCELQKDLLSVLERHADAVCVGVEELFFAKNAKTAMMVSEARGVILFTVASRGIRIEEIKPVEVKAAIVGSGRATKEEIQRMIQLTFRLEAPPQPDDAADAIAIALAVAPRFIHSQ
jgi:crossover junction endodeoxyribonuclease RuvC